MLWYRIAVFHPQMSIQEAYQTLGLDRDTTDMETYKAQIRNLLKQWHPDMHAQDPPDQKAMAEEKMKQINNAAEVVENDIKSGKQQHYEFDRGADSGFEEDFNPFTDSMRPGESDEDRRGQQTTWFNQFYEHWGEFMEEVANSPAYDYLDEASPYEQEHAYDDWANKRDYQQKQEDHMNLMVDSRNQLPSIEEMAQERAIITLQNAKNLFTRTKRFQNPKDGINVMEVLRDIVQSGPYESEQQQHRSDAKTFLEIYRKFENKYPDDLLVSVIQFYSEIEKIASGNQYNYDNSWLYEIYLRKFPNQEENAKKYAQAIGNKSLEIFDEGLQQLLSSPDWASALKNAETRTETPGDKRLKEKSYKFAKKYAPVQILYHVVNSSVFSRDENLKQQPDKAAYLINKIQRGILSKDNLEEYEKDLYESLIAPPDTSYDETTIYYIDYSALENTYYVLDRKFYQELDYWISSTMSNLETSVGYGTITEQEKERVMQYMYELVKDPAQLSQQNNKAIAKSRKWYRIASRVR